MGQRRRQPLVGPTGARLDGADRHAQLLGDLLVGVTQQVRAPHHLALVRREGIDRPANLEPLPRLLDRLAVDLHVDFGLVAAAGRAPLRSEGVDRGVAGDRVQPRRDLAPGFERRQPPATP